MTKYQLQGYSTYWATIIFTTPLHNR